MLKSGWPYRFLILLSIIAVACSTRNTPSENTNQSKTSKTASQILGDSNYLAICYGGYRHDTRDSQPSLAQIKEDMKILHAIGIRILRTYNTHFQEATTILKAISELQKEDSNFEMYVMLGAWIDCENAWTGKTPNHDKENETANKAEIERAIDLANKYPEIVKIISVGNEARVKWQTSYFVQPKVILQWVNYLQNQKKAGKLDASLWITSSDNFASWGGGDSTYHCQDLEQLIKAVDFVSLHTYPMHDTHYNPSFWGSLNTEVNLPKTDATELLMQRAVSYAQTQYTNTLNYIHSIDSTKPVHIGETG
jgi:exo-beta-1,3-glucanase (GH17 family)